MEAKITNTAASSNTGGRSVAGAKDPIILAIEATMPDNRLSDLLDLEGSICDLKDLTRLMQSHWDSKTKKVDATNYFISLNLTHEELDAMTFAIYRVYREANALKEGFYAAVEGRAE